MSNIADAVAAARTAAAESVTKGTNVVSMNNTNNVPATTSAPTGRAMTLDDFEKGMNVEDYVKVKEFGLLLGKAPGELLATIRVAIDMTEVQPCQAIKAGNPAKYWKTYDGVATVTGMSWEEAQRQAKQIDPSQRSNPYLSADIPMTLVEEVKGKTGNVLAIPGTRLGHSLSTTNKGEFQNFLKDVKRQDLASGQVEVELGFKPMSRNGNNWGIVTFKVLGAYAGEE